MFDEIITRIYVFYFILFLVYFQLLYCTFTSFAYLIDFGWQKKEKNYYLPPELVSNIVEKEQYKKIAVKISSLHNYKQPVVFNWSWLMANSLHVGVELKTLKSTYKRGVV